MNPEIEKYYHESPEVEEWLNAPGGKPSPPAAGSADWRDWSKVDAYARKLYETVYRSEFAGTFDSTTAYKQDFWRAIARAAMKCPPNAADERLAE